MILEPGQIGGIEEQLRTALGATVLWFHTVLDGEVYLPGMDNDASFCFGQVPLEHVCPRAG